MHLMVTLRVDAIGVLGAEVDNQEARRHFLHQRIGCCAAVAAAGCARASG